MGRIGTVVMALIAVALAAARPSHAACEIVGVQSVMPSTMNVGSFSATALPPPGTFSLTVMLSVTGHGGGCKGEYGLVRTTAPAAMVRVPPAAVTLPYGVTSSGSAILSYGVTATTRRRLPNFHVSNGTTTMPVTLNFTVTPTPPAAVPATGSYADQLTLHIFNREHGARILVGQLPVTIATRVVDSCSLSTINALNLNFSADVASGVPAGATQNIAFNVNCTGPSRVRLQGAALQAPGVTPSGAFDNFIDYRAIASFGAASATLNTNGTTPTSVTSPSTSNLSGTNLPVSVNVNLIARRPLIGNATYTGVLRVLVDPAF